VRTELPTGVLKKKKLTVATSNFCWVGGGQGDVNCGGENRGLSLRNGIPVFKKSVPLYEKEQEENLGEFLRGSESIYF